jgi:hypothetical protein
MLNRQLTWRTLAAINLKAFTTTGAQPATTTVALALAWGSRMETAVTW